MGNFLKETVAKVAGNVTQSVTSAVIVTLITTYVLVDVGKKKDSTGSVPNSDSLKINSAQQPMQHTEDNSSGELEKKSNQDRPTQENKPFFAGKQKTDGRVAPANEDARIQGGGEVQTVADKTVKHPKLETSLAASKAKIDSVAKEKQAAKDVKQVQKRAEDVFDELDEEVAKKPPQ